MTCFCLVTSSDQDCHGKGNSSTTLVAAESDDGQRDQVMGDTYLVEPTIAGVDDSDDQETPRTSEVILAI